MNGRCDVSRKPPTHLILASNSRFTLTTREDQDLVNGVYFVANVSSNWDLHAHELAVQAGVKDFPELSKCSHLRGEAWEVDHLMSWWI